MASDEVDEMTGTYYAARRIFLSDDNNNPLKPPNEFMTRKQLRNSLKVNRGSGLEVLRTLDCFKDAEGVESKKDKKRKEQETRHRHKQPVFVLEKYSSTRKEDWTEELQAGCRMWINHTTGEVSAECPYLDQGENKSNDDEDGIATGAMVYDNSAELLELFEQLDAEANKQKK